MAAAAAAAAAAVGGAAAADDAAASLPAPSSPPLALVSAAGRTRAAATALAAPGRYLDVAALCAAARALPSALAAPHAWDALAPLPLPPLAVTLREAGATVHVAWAGETRPPLGSVDAGMRSPEALREYLFGATSETASRASGHDPGSGSGATDRSGRCELLAGDAWLAAWREGAAGACDLAAATVRLAGQQPASAASPAQRAQLLSSLMHAICVCIPMLSTTFARWAPLPTTAALSPSTTSRGVAGGGAPGPDDVVSALCAAVRVVAGAPPLPADEAARLSARRGSIELAALLHDCPWAAQWLIDVTAAAMRGGAWRELLTEQHEMDAAEGALVAALRADDEPRAPAAGAIAVTLATSTDAATMASTGGTPTLLHVHVPPRPVGAAVATRFTAAWLLEHAPLGAPATVGSLLPLAFRLCDDWTATCVWLGMSGLRRLAREAAATELRTFAPVLEDLLRRTVVIHHPTVAVATWQVRAALLPVLHGPPPAIAPASLALPSFVGAYDAAIGELLSDVSLAVRPVAKVSALARLLCVLADGGALRGALAPHATALVAGCAAVAMDATSSELVLAALAAMRALLAAFPGTLAPALCSDPATVEGAGAHDLADSVVTVDVDEPRGETVAAAQLARSIALTDQVVGAVAVVRAHAGMGLLHARVAAGSSWLSVLPAEAVASGGTWVWAVPADGILLGVPREWTRGAPRAADASTEASACACAAAEALAISVLRALLAVAPDGAGAAEWLRRRLALLQGAVAAAQAAGAAAIGAAV